MNLNYILRTDGPLLSLTKIQLKKKPTMISGKDLIGCVCWS